MTYPVVEKERPRIHVIIHAGNTEEEIDLFLRELLAWAEQQESPQPLEALVTVREREHCIRRQDRSFRAGCFRFFTSLFVVR